MGLIQSESLTNEAFQTISCHRIPIGLRNRESQPRFPLCFLSTAPADPHRQTGPPDPMAFLEDPLKIALPVKSFVPAKPLIQTTLLGD